MNGTSFEDAWGLKPITNVDKTIIRSAAAPVNNGPDTPTKPKVADSDDVQHLILEKLNMLQMMEYNNSIKLKQMNARFRILWLTMALTILILLFNKATNDNIRDNVAWIVSQKHR